MSYHDLDDVRRTASTQPFSILRGLVTALADEIEQLRASRNEWINKHDRLEREYRDREREWSDQDDRRRAQIEFYKAKAAGRHRRPRGRKTRMSGRRRMALMNTTQEVSTLGVDSV